MQTVCDVQRRATAGVQLAGYCFYQFRILSALIASTTKRNEVFTEEEQ